MISIITPVYNGAQYIRENIESIKQLTVPYEHIIVDGGSTDDTLKILNEYSHLIILNQTEKTGMYGAIDIGFKYAQGEFITWINCDDRIIPDGYAKMYEFAVTGNFDFVCSDGNFYYVNEQKNKKVKGTRFAKYFLQKGLFPFSQPSTIYKKSNYNNVGGLNYNNYRICGDMDLFYRLAIIEGTSFSYIPVVSTVFLKHGNSLGDKNSILSLHERKANGVIPQPSFFIQLIMKIIKITNL